MIDQAGLDCGRTVPRQSEARLVKLWPLVQVLMVSHARHDRDSLEDLLGSKKEMVPVCPLVSPVHQVAGQQDEFDSRMAPVGSEQSPAPVLKSGLGISHVKEFDSSGLAPAGLGGSPRSPALT